MFRRPIFYVPVLMISTLMGVELALLAAARLIFTGQHFDPFAPYQAIMPGQPSTELSQFRCPVEQDIHRIIRCQMQADDGIFSEVSVLLDTRNRIVEVTFIPKGLRLGSLVQRLGFPEINYYKGFYLLRWQRDGVHMVISSDSRKQPPLNVMASIDAIILS